MAKESHKYAWVYFKSCLPQDWELSSEFFTDLPYLAMARSRGPSRNKTAYEIPNLWNFGQRFQIPKGISNTFKYRILNYSKIY